MLPVLFEIGGLSVTSFGVMMALSFFTAGWILSKELRRLGQDPEIAWDLVVYAAVGGLVGARVYYLILRWEDTVADPWGAIASRAGLVWYGGFLLAAALILWRLYRGRLPIPTFADAVAPALALAYAVGRLGCFLVGDDYGRPTDLAWGIAFPQGAPPSTAGNLRDMFGVAVPPEIAADVVLTVHPTQLYEVAMALAMFGVLWRLRGRLPVPGSLFAAYLALAGVERFVVEIFRAKDDRFLGGLTLAQAISVLLVLAAVAAFQWLRRPRGGTQVAVAPRP